MSTTIEIPKTFARNPDYVIPIAPGEHLKEKIDEMNMSDEEFATQADLSLEVLLLLYKGVIPVNQELADKLEKATLIPADLWLRFEKRYRDDLVSAAEKYGLSLTG